MIFLDQTLRIAGYEGARKGIQFDANNSDVVASCNTILNARQVASASIDIVPADVTSVPSGQTISVTVSAPCDANAIMPAWYFGGRTLAATVTMVKE